MARLNPTTRTIKRLFAYTGNQCAMPNCKEVLVDSSGTMLGKIAHICAAEAGGLRYDASMNDEDRRADANLFIICGKHHDIIDDKYNLAKYPVELLRKIKKEHEHRFKKAELQLIAQFVDSTQSNQPTYPKHLRAFARALGDESHYYKNKDEISGVRAFIDKLKELPLIEREFAIRIAETMRRRKVEKLLTSEVERNFDVSRTKLIEHMQILEEHGLGCVDPGEEHNQHYVHLNSRRPGWNPWIEILDFCDATNRTSGELIHELNFALYDDAD